MEKSSHYPNICDAVTKTFKARKHDLLELLASARPHGMTFDDLVNEAAHRWGRDTGTYRLTIESMIQGLLKSGMRFGSRLLRRSRRLLCLWASSRRASCGWLKRKNWRSRRLWKRMARSSSGQGRLSCVSKDGKKNLGGPYQKQVRSL